MNAYRNADSAGYFDGASNGLLLLQKCPKCASYQFPPRHLCQTCWHDELDWTESSGRGLVESLTVVHRAPTAEFRDKVPFIIVAVQLDEGVRMITNLVGEGAMSARIGDRVRVAFEADASGNALPQFCLA